MQTQRTVFAENSPGELACSYRRCRDQSRELARGLSDADATVQSMEDASPTKWHLAHTTWFFEEFLLVPELAGYEPYRPEFRFLFNSYYETVGPRHPRPRRGLLTRPSLDEIFSYRAHVDRAMDALLSQELAPATRALVALGLAHEEQHQELILTDLLHLFAQNPLRPAFRPAPELAAVARTSEPLEWVEYPGGIVRIGANPEGFAFDCERPVHDALLRPYALASRPVINREWMEFIDDGGYADARWWLSDGFASARTQGWDAPLYWRREGSLWLQMTLYGERAVEPESPVAHVSFFEADAFARWSKKRLPTEFEWEQAAIAQTIPAPATAPARFRPRTAAEDVQRPLRQLFGDVWEWTASPYLAYPGFVAETGAIGEYNGKFMCGQFVLRGGSCATPAGHIRSSYRNFFYPGQRWQFSGLRLAEDRS